MLKCETTGVFLLNSRVSVLETSEISNRRDYDYGLVTGHGAPLKHPCFVQDFMGNKKKVRGIWHSPNFDPGTDSDWAVISFKKMKTSNLVRYPLKVTQTNWHDQPVNFAAARGLPNNNQLCKISELHFPKKTETKKRKVVTHNCRSIPGQSGSPLTTRIHETETLVGFHIGRIWMLSAPDTMKPGERGYLRVIDQDIVSQISNIIQYDDK